MLYGSEVSCSDTQPHQSGFQRAATSRHSFHGNIQERRGLPQRNSIRRDSEGQNRLYDDRQQDRETSSRDSFDISSERRGSRRWKEHKNIRDGEKDANEHRIRRTTSERQPSHRSTEQSLSLEEEREVERPDRRVPQRSQSLSSGRALVRHRSRHVPAGNSQNCSQLSSAEGTPPKLSVCICSSHLTSINIKSLEWGLSWYFGSFTDVEMFLFHSCESKYLDTKRLCLAHAFISYFNFVLSLK